MLILTPELIANALKNSSSLTPVTEFVTSSLNPGIDFSSDLTFLVIESYLIVHEVSICPKPVELRDKLIKIDIIIILIFSIYLGFKETS
jgi:hypothetical protein